nr:hypothetical transcript [Hymenolepis microstoma]
MDNITKELRALATYAFPFNNSADGLDLEPSVGTISHQLPAYPRGDEFVKKISALSTSDASSPVSTLQPTTISPTPGICAASVAYLGVGIWGSSTHLTSEIIINAENVLRIYLMAHNLGCNKLINWTKDFIKTSQAIPTERVAFIANYAQGKRD